MKRVLLLLTMITCAILCKAQGVDNSTIPALDLGRYLGKWFEIARYDHSFERGMDYTTAEYSMQDNGMIKVVNSGMKDGRQKTSIGKARTTDKPAMLRVSFFGPFYSDYRVLMISEDYGYVLVGSRSPKYLWILSRTPDVPDGMLQSILAEASRRGYDTDKLIWVKH